MVAGLGLWAAASAWVMWRRPRSRWVIGVILLASLGARLVLVPQTPDVSGDINRYVWDGRVQAEGINPYRYPPDDQRLAYLRDGTVWPNINHISDPTIYPPVAQATFGALHQSGLRSVSSVKLAFALIDTLSVLLLAVLLSRIGRPPTWAVIYGWHPLAILEVGRSGHVDAVAVDTDAGGFPGLHGTSAPVGERCAAGRRRPRQALCRGAAAGPGGHRADVAVGRRSGPSGSPRSWRTCRF